MSCVPLLPSPQLGVTNPCHHEKSLEIWEDLVKITMNQLRLVIVLTLAIERFAHCGWYISLWRTVLCCVFKADQRRWSEQQYAY